MTSPGGFDTPSEMVAAEERARARFLQLKNGITRDQAANIGALYRENPSMPPGALYAMGVGGVRPGSAAFRAAGEADLQKKHENKEFSFGRLVGKGWRATKRAVDAVTPDGTGSVLREGVYEPVKGVSRGAFGLAMAPGQALQATFRQAAADGDVTAGEVLSAPRRFGEQLATGNATSFGAMVRQIKQGGLGGVDVGSGFFIGGAAGAAQRDYAVEQAPMQVNGRRVGVTMGRYLARTMDLEPGGVAWNTVSGLADATIALSTDPTMYVAGPTRALQARRSFSGDASRGTARELDRAQATQVVPRFARDVAADMGALDGLRRTVNSDRVFEWLTRKDEGRTLVRYLAGETDFERAWRATKGKLDPKLVLQLTERTHGEDEVIGILGPVLGRTAQTSEKFKVDALVKVQSGMVSGGARHPFTLATARWKNTVDTTRMFGTMPERTLPKDDLPGAIRNMDAFLRNAKVPQAERSGILARLAATDGVDEMFDVAKDAMALGVTQATDLGIPADRARELFTMWQKSNSSRRRYWQGQVANGYANRAFAKDPDLFRLERDEMQALPHLASQFLDHNIPLPDPREIRAALSPYRNILGNKAVRLPLMALESIQDNLFKPGVLLRPAYVLRNQIDEQFRPAGVGLPSLFNHPVQYLNWIITDQRGVGRMLSRAGYGQRGARDVNGVDFDPLPRLRAELKDAKRTGNPDRIRDAEGQVAQARLARRSTTPFTDAASEYARSISGGVGNWRNARAAELKDDALFDRANDGANYNRALAERLHLIFTDPLASRVARGDAFPGDVRPGNATGVDGIKDWWWAGAGQGFRRDLAAKSERMKWVEEADGALRYVDDTAVFVDDVVAGSPVLREAAATGKINGIPLMKSDGLQVNPAAVDELERLRVDPAFLGPAAVPGKVKGDAGLTDSWSAKYNDAVNWAFYQLADRPSAYLSRSPAFRQRYYRRLEALMSFVDDSAAQKIIQGARDANLKPRDLRRIEAARRPGGTVTFDEADLVAKTDALEFTRDLFYSLHERSQFFDITRLLFPFGEAFKDGAVKYSQIVAKNPVLPYRLGQGIQAGRNEDVDGDGRGFFYTDEQTGEEMFAWPGSGALMDGLGVGAIRSPLKNLNILGTSVVPGFGPAVQVAAGKMLPDDPDFDGIRDIINPYGDRSLEGGVVESFLPAWFGKAYLALDPDGWTAKQDRAFVNAQKDVMGYLASTGEYDLQSEAGIEELQDDARTRARAVFAIRGLAQAFAPSPPSPEFVAYDKSGVLLTQFRLAEEYRRIQDEQDAAGTPENTNRVFIERFGADAVLSAVSNTKAGQYQSPVQPNAEAEAFYQRHRDAAQRFPSVFGLFAPPGSEAAQFDFAAYERQLRTGERVVISPREAVERANRRVATMIYNQAREFAGDDPSPQAQKAMRDLRARLSEDFPGYSNSFHNDFPRMIEDLKRAAKDSDLAETPQGQALSIWLQAREVAEQTAQSSLGTGWARSDRALPVREKMRRLAFELSGDFPGFQDMYERVLEREMVDE